MSTLTRAQLDTLRRPILRSVSRSFYLSIRFLPAQLRDPIGLAYLLARATDTIADTHEIDGSVRRQHLASLAALIQGDADLNTADTLVGSFAPLQRNDAERKLIAQLPATLEWLNAIDQRDRDDIREVLAHINEGQALDVARFAGATGVTALETAAALDRYTYLVAGSVGEFWTRICTRYVQDFSSLTEERMTELGISYGKGLQLINILRDLGSDLRGGRCYLPADQLRSLGIEPAGVMSNATKLEPLLREWRERAADGISAGIEYACAIRPWRVRFATVLPALIGVRTLRLLAEAGPQVLQHQVKISRAEVRRILLHMGLRFASPSAIRREFQRLSA